MRSLTLLALAAGAIWSTGCASSPRPIFPRVSPELVWPPAPDVPRIRYIGELHGEESLGVRASGWKAFEQAITGPPGKIEFSRPSAVAVRGSRVYVADTGLGCVHVLDLDARTYNVIRGAAGDPLRVPIDLAIDDAGTLMVVDRGRSAIDLFDQAGKWCGTQKWPELRGPVSIALDAAGGPHWILDAAEHCCFRWWPADRRIERLCGGRGAGPGKFNFPSALAWDKRIGLVVADAMNFRVQVLDADSGEAMCVFGEKGDAAGDFARPRDVAIDSEAHLYVLDNQFENVQVFDSHGRLLMAFGGGGEEAGMFSIPSGITIDSNDRIWIADSYNRRVQVFEYLPEQE